MSKWNHQGHNSEALKLFIHPVLQVHIGDWVFGTLGLLGTKTSYPQKEDMCSP